MNIEQRLWTEEKGWEIKSTAKLDSCPEVVFVFGNRSVLEKGQALEELKKDFGSSQIFGCSTSGEIIGTKVMENTLVATAVKFEHSRVQGHLLQLSDPKASYDAGKILAQRLDKDGLAHVFVLSEGINVNGSELAKGLNENLPKDIMVSGGLAGDGEKFERTIIVLNDECKSNAVALLGIYGSRLDIGCASRGGWDSFGPERLITKSEGNVLFELDGQSALSLYKKYLGEHAKGLPASGLLFPLSLRTREKSEPLVRTILAVNERDQSMTFAGDLPEGAYARLMKANFDRLIDGAEGAAEVSKRAMKRATAQMALLISCVGRKMVLKQRIEEEVEGVLKALNSEAALTGFYSYGEISPFTPNAKCELHNQTMTITTLAEF